MGQTESFKEFCVRYMSVQLKCMTSSHDFEAGALHERFEYFAANKNVAKVAIPPESDCNTQCNIVSCTREHLT